MTRYGFFFKLALLYSIRKIILNYWTLLSARRRTCRFSREEWTIIYIWTRLRLFNRSTDGLESFPMIRFFFTLFYTYEIRSATPNPQERLDIFPESKFPNNLFFEWHLSRMVFFSDGIASDWYFPPPKKKLYVPEVFITQIIQNNIVRDRS